MRLTAAIGAVTRVLVVTASVAAASAVAATLAPGTPTAVAAGPTAADLGIDFPAEMAAVVSARHAPALTADRSALTSADSALAGAEAHQASDTSLADQATAMVATDTAALSGAVSALAAATGAVADATAAVADDHRRLGAIAVSLYTDPDGADPSLPGTQSLAVAQAEANAQTLVTVVTDGEEQRLSADVATLGTDRRRQSADSAAVTADTTALATVRRLQVDRTEVLGADAAGVSAASGRVDQDQAALAADTATAARALAAVAEPPGAPADGSPTILGGAALDAAQMAGWYDAQGYDDLTATPIAQLASWYLSEGAAEGVRGDVAFAQAMVETAGFSSSDAVGANNYAGIGHCDSCAGGLPFPTAQLGVRAQVQLLHGFADATLTTATLANPPVDPSLTPETEPDRGCCATWQSLTGTWASDPLYGHTVMSVYGSMLSFALSPPPGPG